LLKNKKNPKSPKKEILEERERERESIGFVCAGCEREIAGHEKIKKPR
jgi:hypothetical protein